MDQNQIEALLTALRVALEGEIIDKLEIVIKPNAKPKPADK